jgi:hypothetical protein
MMNRQIGTYNPPPEAGVRWTFQINRNSTLGSYLLESGWQRVQPPERAHFAHWDSFGDVGPSNAEIECFPKETTNCIDCIWTYFKRVECFGSDSVASTASWEEKGFPETFFDWRHLDKATIDSSPIWFLKSVYGVHGKGITLIGNWEEYQKSVDDVPTDASRLIGPSGVPEEVEEMHYLQRGICNCHLFEGRKYVLRVYYLTMGDGTMYVYDDALGYAHGPQFDPSDKSWHMHVSHVNVPGKYEGNVDDRTYFTLRHQDFGSEVMRKIMVHSEWHLGIIQDAIRESRCNPQPAKRVDDHHYHVWGADYLVGVKDRDLNVTLIELNAAPNMNHNIPRQGGQIQQNEVDFREEFDPHMMRRVFRQHDVGNKWIEVLPPFDR